LANTPSAAKRARQAEQRRARNASRRSVLRTYIKKVVRAIEAKDKDAAQAAYSQTVPIIDRMVTQGIIHKNKAARYKSRLNAGVRAL
jgi:small subunit ribosomal protein S20